MAQDTPTRPEAPQQTEAKGRDSRFHYYSGGEVKEMTGTGVSTWMWVIWTVVIVGAVLFFLFGGALGPNGVGPNPGYKPVGGSTANLNRLQQELNTQGNAAGLTYASVDLNQLPIPQGEGINQAIAKGSEVYQTYCIGCHGPNQDGNGVNAGSLNPKPRNLHDAPFMQGLSYQRINTSLHKGVPGTAMPRWENTLDETQIGNVIAYVFSLTSPAIGASSVSVAQTASPQPTQSGGSKTFQGAIQNSPKPITPAIGGNPAAPTSTAPPSVSGPTPADTNAMMQPGGTGSEASKNLAPESPTAGGENVTTPSTPKTAPPVSSSATPSGAAGSGM